jgi:hypothetical protein
MFRMTALTVVLILAFAGAARADDCEFEGAAGSLRTPVQAAGGSATVVASEFADESDDGLGNPDELNVTRYTLPARGAAHRAPLPGGLSPTPDGVMWRPGRGLVAGSRVLVPGLPFPGYRGVAAVTAQDGTITLLYASGGQAVLQRFAPDGSAGPATTVAPAPAPTDPTDPYTFEPQLTIDAAGTVFGVVTGDDGGVAIRWPAGEPPQLTPSPRLLRSEPSLVADQHGGAWVLVDKGASLSLLHVTAAGIAVTRLRADAEFVTNVTADPTGDAVLAYTQQGHAHVQRVTLAGVAASPTSLPGGAVEAIAWARGNPWVLAGHGDALYLDGPRDQVLVRAKPRFGEDDASLAISGGRAWAVWDEVSDRLDAECDEFPASAQVLWASFGLHDGTVIARGLPGAATLF